MSKETTARRWSRMFPVAFIAGWLALSAGCNSGGPYPASTHVKPLTHAAFETDVVQSKLPVVVDFYAVWCGPCRLQAPKLDQLAGEMEGHATFFQVDVDKERELSAQFGIQAIPTLLVFHEGKVVETFVGLTPAEKLKAKLESLGSSAQ